MTDRYSDLLRQKLTVKWGEDKGPIDMSSHSMGIGGIHPTPPSKAIVEATAALKPQMIRIFIQEFFYIYKGNGEYDWSALDAYMDAVHAMGGDIMATICNKPNALYPKVNESIWMPTDVAEWQEMIRNMVVRYTKEKPYVTHWGIANEQNIGELGGCPYMIKNPDEYYEYYKFTAAPIHETLPDVKVGGSSHAGGGQAASDYNKRFLELCIRDGVAVDFVSYNSYNDSPGGHAQDARIIRDMLDKVKPDVKLYMTEFNIAIDDGLSLEEKPYEPACAASLAASIISLYNDGSLEGSFQYHIYDQYCDPRLFAPWYERARYMARYWNDTVNRVGLVDQKGKARPQYFVYKLLYKLSGKRVGMCGTSNLVNGIASKSDDGTLSLLLVNYGGRNTPDCVTRLFFEDAPEGLYTMKVSKIDKANCNKMKDDFMYELPLSEDRLAYVHPDFQFDVLIPGETVCLVQFVKAE